MFGKKQVLYFLFFCSLTIGNAQKGVLFFQTDWGFEGEKIAFIEKAKASGYDGIEVWAPRDPSQQKEISAALKKYNMKVIFLCGSNPNLPYEESLREYISYLKNTFKLNPLAVNSHTGSDFYSYEQNRAFIEQARKLSNDYGIPIYHETHRGRFSYSMPETIKYLEKNDALNLTLDISHWMVVHESLLDNRADLFDKVIHKSRHIHARVGFEEGPQVNDPTAPEWEIALKRHLAIWEAVIQKNWEEKKTVSITTEFGPPNYMPTEPITRRPLSSQWEANVFIMKTLKDKIKNMR